MLPLRKELQYRTTTALPSRKIISSDSSSPDTRYTFDGMMTLKLKGDCETFDKLKNGLKCLS